MGKNRRKWLGGFLAVLVSANTSLPNMFIGSAKAAEISSSLADHVVISEVYGGGGNKDAPYTNDFIELYNPTDEDVDLTGWSVQYASASGTFNSVNKLISADSAKPLLIKAHGYFLIQGDAGTTLSYPLPNADAAFKITMSGTAGRVALANNSTTVTSKTDANVVDYVGYGSTATPYLGSGPTPAPSNTTSVERRAADGTDPSKEGAGKGNGYNTPDNSKDFVSVAPNPQNSSSPSESLESPLENGGGDNGGTTPVPDPTPAPDPTEVSKISALRPVDASGKSILLNQKVMIEGTITVSNNVLGKNSFYIQDDTGGVNIFGITADNLELKQGDKIQVMGTVAAYNGLTEIIPSKMTYLSEGSLPEAKTATVADLNESKIAEPLEGMLVKVSGKATSIPASLPGNVTLTDENGKSVIIRIQNTTDITLADSLKANSSYEITGILGQYSTSATASNGYQLYPRSKADIKEVFPVSIRHEAIEKAYKDTDLAISAEVTGAESVKLFYKASGAAGYVEKEMKGSGTSYSFTLAKEDVPQDGFDYYITAENKTENTQSGSAEKPYHVTLIEDKEGPAFFNETPVKDTTVEDKQPVISVQMADDSGVAADQTKISIDGRDYTDHAETTADKITLALSEDLKLDKHEVIVTALDKKGNSAEYKWSFTVAEAFTGGHHFRGTTHNHTNLSHDAAGSPEEALKAAKARGYDWFAFSDHSHDIDADLSGKDTVDHKGMPERTGGSNWQLTKDLAKEYTKDDFTVFPAFEMTSTTWGHSNVFGTDNFIERNMNSKKYQDLNQYYAWVLTYDDIVAQFNHPDMSANAFNNFTPYDKNVDKLFTMFEVGNGSGHYSYFNAEKKFYTALDLGWHVAPTFGEDNHDGTWGQTMRRTVIVSTNNKQASLLHAMRNMRVYMAEDPNFTLDVLGNGKYMGSVVNGDSISFSIKGSDDVTESASMKEYDFLDKSYKSDDNIEKVELITNGSKVVESIKPEGNSFEWNPSVKVTGGQQWYVVKVTQKDGDQIYSSPIWSAEKAVDVRISGLELTEGSAVTGNPAEMKAGISNLGTSDLTNVNVMFYYDEVKANNLIGTAKLDSIPAKSVKQASAKWNSPEAGSHKLIAVIDSPEGDNPADNTFTLEIKVKEALGLTLMIDASHKNENTSTDTGTYKNNFTAFTKMAKKEGYTVVENTQPLTADTLKDVKVLVMTHANSKLTDAEKQAVADYVKTGGSVLLTEKSAYGTADPTANNDMLEQMGATAQFNSDQINDDTKEGNFWSTPLTSKYSVRLHPSLVDNYLTDRVPTVEYYSGSSLKAKGNEKLTDSSSVTILARGNETTYQSNAGSEKSVVYDIVSDDKGGLEIPAIASETVGEGKIVLAGMNFMNDKQLDESYNTKGNDELAMNAVNWLAERPITIAAIEKARSLEDNEEVIVEGTVTTAAGTFFDAFYVQDKTGGIMAFNEVPDGSLKLGDKVRIYGHLKTFENNKELEFDDFSSDVLKIGSGTPVEPKMMSTEAAGSKENMGLLVKVKGQVVSQYDENSYVVNDGSKDILVFTDGYIVKQSGALPALKKGDWIEAAGLSGEFKDGIRIRVRDTKEVKKINASGGTDITPPNAPLVNEVTDQSTNVTGTTEAGAYVEIRIKGQQLANGGAGADGKFAIAIPKQKAGTEFSITAKDAAGNTSPAVVMVVKDVTAPDKPAVNTVTDQSKTVTGKAESGSLVSITVNGQSLASGTADKDGRLVIAIPVQKADTELTVTAKDAAGNASPAAVTVVKDVTAPGKPVVNPVSDQDKTIIGTTEAEATVSIAVNGKIVASGKAKKDGSFTIGLIAKKAGQKLSITAADKAGNKSTAAIVIVADATAPVTTVKLSPSQKSAVYSSGVTLILKTSDNYAGVKNTYYKVNNGSWQTYSHSVRVKVEGSYKISFKSIDKKGNEEKTKQISFTINIKDVVKKKAAAAQKTAAKKIRSVKDAQKQWTAASKKADKLKADAYGYADSSQLASILGTYQAAAAQFTKAGKQTLLIDSIADGYVKLYKKTTPATMADFIKTSLKNKTQQNLLIKKLKAQKINTSVLFKLLK